VSSIKSAGASWIRMVSIVSAPEGLKALEESHPDVDVVTAAVDRELNEHAYILPGLGDMGDRLFGTLPEG
jgi:uracil phosphoribosyltransferase